MNTEELKIEICDIETYKAMFLYYGYDPGTDTKFVFEISARKNQIDGLVKHLLEYPRDFMVTFNGVRFDSQVLQYIIDNHESWVHFTWREIVDLIFEFAQQTIDDQNYELPAKYKEYYMSFKQIDLFLVLHYNNDAKRCSLKWAGEFSLDGDIEELPIDFRKEDLTNEEIEEIIKYCRNDVMATCNLYMVTIGNTEHPDYKGKNKIQLRLDLIEEYNFPWTAINWNDVKIGAELNKKVYMQIARINEAQLYGRVKQRKTKTGFYFNECFPEYIKFETPEFNEFFKKLGKTKVNLNEKQEFPFTYKGATFMFAKGGGHSNDQPRIINLLPGQIMLDADVGSMYPNKIRKSNIYPAHLGPEWNQAYVLNIPKRLEAKKKYKETGEKKYDNFQECFKLVMNGNFGRLGDRFDWQYDPFAAMQVTIGSQVDIFMLAEDLAQIPTLQIISMNTDGLTVVLDEKYVQQYYQTCKAWEEEVGNDVLGNLEYVQYSKFIQTSVNDYLAVKVADWVEKDGEFKAIPIDKPLEKRLKKKGDFLTSYELHKNKSKCIVPIALEKYFTQGIPVEDTIKNHRNIFDFCIAKKASRDYFYRTVDRKTGTVTDMNKLVRYYCAVAPKEEKKLLPLVDVTEMEQIVMANGFIKNLNGKYSRLEWSETNGRDWYSTDPGIPLLEAYASVIKDNSPVAGKIYKMKNPNSEKTGPEKSNCESDSEQQVIFNRPFTPEKWEDYGVDYDYYIRQTNKIISKISPEYAREIKAKESLQISLF